MLAIALGDVSPAAVTAPARWGGVLSAPQTDTGRMFMTQQASSTAQTTNSRRWQFDHHRLDAYRVALEALVGGEAIIKQLPRGYGKLADQLRRALLGAHLQTSEAAARTGADRRARFRIARAEACEAAAALEAIEALGLAHPSKVEPVIALLWRLCAMLTKLARLAR